jgi:protease-4
MAKRMRRAVGVTALIFFLSFAAVLGLLTVGEPPGVVLGGNRVAVIDVEGVIVDADRVVRELEAEAEDPSVRAIVVRIQSPGGVVAPTQEIYDAILKARERGKPVVASMGSVAASGGYYLAAAADKIVANPGTLTGSIGVLMQLVEVEGLLKKVGVRYEVIKAGRFKDVGSLGRPMTDEERAVLQALLDDMYEQFVTAVVSGRRLERARVLDLADGRVYSGRRAQELGLVDTLGGLEEAIQVAGQLGGVSDPKVKRARRGPGLLEFLEWLGSRTPWKDVAGGGLGLPLLGSTKIPLYLMD